MAGAWVGNALRGATAALRWLAVGIFIVLAGCSDSGGGNNDSAGNTPAAPGTLTGVAAIGAPIVGGTVIVKGASGNPITVSTGAGGVYTVTLTGLTGPYILQLSGGTVNGASNTLVLHSVATGAGRANITTLTDMLVAALLRADPAAFFQSVGTTGGGTTANITSANISAAVTLVTQFATSLGVNITAFPNFLTIEFQAVTGNAFDQILEALRAAFTTNNTTLAGVRSQLITGAASFNGGGGSGGGGGTGTGGGTGSGTGAQCNELLTSGTYNLEFTQRFVASTAAGNTTTQTPTTQTLRIANATFQGESALMHEVVQNGRPLSRTYYSVGSSEYSLMGTESFDANTGAATTTTSYSPRPRYPRTINLGQTVNNTYRLTVSGTASSVSDVTEEVTFSARENVSVTAGTFTNTCKFTGLTNQRTTTAGVTVDARNESTSWLGNGLARALSAVKLETRTTTTTFGIGTTTTSNMELISATVNGTRLP